MSDAAELVAKELADVVIELADVKLKLQAFSDVLHDHNPNLHREWEARIGNLKKSKAFEMNLLSLEGFRQRLVDALRK